MYPVGADEEGGRDADEKGGEVKAGRCSVWGDALGWVRLGGIWLGGRQQQQQKQVTDLAFRRGIRERKVSGVVWGYDTFIDMSSFLV